MKRILSLVLAAIMVLGLFSGIAAAEETGYGESPVLAAKVAAGELPPVEERLPEKDDIFVETTAANGQPLEIGQYTEYLNRTNTGSSWQRSRYGMSSIVLYNIDGTRYPNVIKAYDHNEDFTEWTFYLRKGMKWSDGEAFTTEDIAYWYYMLHLTNFDTNAYWQGLWTADAEGNKVYATLEVIDDYTCKWVFAAPIFEDDFLCGDLKWCWAPAHFWLANKLFPASYYMDNPYFENPGTSDEEALANALKLGLDYATVAALGDGIAYYGWEHWQVPTIWPWIEKEGMGQNPGDEDVNVLVRNPYFWKVDAEGNQLPYIDEIRAITYNDNDQAMLAFLSGDLDAFEIGIDKVATLRAENGDQVKVIANSSTDWATCQVGFNYTVEDPNYYALFNNADFRQAMSIAIDRAAFSDLVYNGLLDPKTTAPVTIGKSDELDQHWTEYDPAKAKELLEGTGLLVMGADGFYDFADGSDLEIVFERGISAETEDTEYAILKQYWNAIGIKTAEHCTDNYAGVIPSDHTNDNTALAWLGHHDALKGIGLISRLKLFSPDYGMAEWSANWWKWFEDPATYTGTNFEPPEEVKKIAELCYQWTQTPTTDERNALETEIVTMIVNSGYTIGMTEGSPSFWAMQNTVHNWFDGITEDKYFYEGICHYWTVFKAE